MSPREQETKWEKWSLSLVPAVVVGAAVSRVCTLLQFPMPIEILLSLICGIFVFLYRINLINTRVTLCRQYPGGEICQYVHYCLIGHPDDIVAPKKLTQSKSSSYSYEGNYDDFLNIIKTLSKHSDRFVQMTLPKNPYDQINHSAYSTFMLALKAVRRNVLSKGKQKVIILNTKNLCEFKKHLREDLLSKKGEDIKKYIRQHYISSYIPIILRKLFLVDLLWIYNNDVREEYLTIDYQVGLLFYDNNNSKIEIELSPKQRFDRNSEIFKNGLSTKKFFREHVLDNNFHKELRKQYKAKYGNSGVEKKVEKDIKILLRHI